jgi:hypothetical protein
MIASIVQQRYFDPEWMVQIWDPTQGEPDAANSNLSDTQNGAGTAVFDATNNALRVTTAGGGNDDAWVHPGITANYSLLGDPASDTIWDTSMQPFMVCTWLPGAGAAGDLFDVNYFCGLVEQEPDAANAAFAIGDYDDAAWFFCVVGNTPATNNWDIAQSVGGVDFVKDSGQLLSRAAFIQMAVFISKARKPYYYINGNLVHVGTSLSASTLLSPVCGVTETAADAKIFDVRYFAYGQRFAA